MDLKEIDFKEKTIMDQKNLIEGKKLKWIQRKKTQIDFDDIDFKEIDFKKKTKMHLKEIDFKEKTIMDFQKMDLKEKNTN